MRRPVVVAVVVAVTVMAAALATSATGDGADLTLPPTDLRLQGAVTAVFAVTAVLAVASLAFIRPGAPRDRYPRRRRSLLSTLAIVLAAVVVATVLDTMRGAGPDDEATTSEATLDEPGSAVEEVVVEPGRVATALLTLLAVGVLVAVAARTQRRRPGAPPAGDDGLRAAVHDGRAVLDGSPASGGPREAILACWRALEAELAALDRARRDDETGAEYLRRALAPLHPPPAAVDRLAALVELARWSTAPLDAGDVASARAALDEVLGGIAAEAGR